jgi:hypothetical protein
VLDQDVVLEHRDLSQVVSLSDDHLSDHRFAPGQELCLAEDGWSPTTSLAALASALPLGLHPGGAFDAGDLMTGSFATGFPNTYDDITGIVRRSSGFLTPATTAAPTPALAIPLGGLVTRGELVGCWRRRSLGKPVG